MVLPLVLGIIGSVFGNAVGGAVGASVGAMIGSMIGTMMSPPKGPDIIGPRLEDLSLQTSSNVADLPRTYGTVAHRGNMIWAKGNALTEVVSTTTKKKKFLGFTVAKQNSTTYKYYLTCAIAFAKIPAGSTVSVIRIWIGDDLVLNNGNADLGTIVASSDFSQKITVYSGTDTQAVDPTIAADVGASNASAYPGIFYIVLRDLDLSSYFNSVSRAEMKVEYSVAAPLGASAATLLDDIPAVRNPDKPDQYNASTLDIDGLHVWKRGTVMDAAGFASDHDKYHYIVLPTGNSFLKEIITDAIPDSLPGDTEYTYFANAAKGKSDVPAQVFSSLFQRVVGGGDGSAPGPNPFLYGDSVTWNGGSSGGHCTLSGVGYIVFANLYAALQAHLNVPASCPGTAATPEYVFNTINQVVEPHQITWFDGGIPSAFFRFYIEFPTYNPFPNGITSADYYGSNFLSWISVQLVRPGSGNKEFKIDIGNIPGISGIPDPGSYFAFYENELFYAFTISGTLLLYKFDQYDNMSIVTFASTSITRMGILNGQLILVTKTGGVAGLTILNRTTLATIDTKDSTELTTLFGVTGSDFYNNATPDFDKIIYYRAGNLYQKATIDGNDEILLGDVTPGLITGSTQPALFSLFRKQSLIADITYGGAMPQTGVQYFSIGLLNAPGTVNLSAIIVQECALAGIEAADIDVSSIVDVVRGYRIASRGSIRNVLQQLQACFPFDVLQSGYKIKFVPRGQSSVATIGWEDLGPEAQWTQDREMEAQLPRKIIFRHLDRDLEYEIGEQYSERPIDSLNETVLEIPIVFTADEAAQRADILHSMYILERKTFTGFILPPPYRALEPSDVITVTLPNATYLVRLTNIQYTDTGSLVCDGKPNAVTIYTSTAKGDAPSAASEIIPIAGPAISLLIDIPVVSDEDSAGFTALMSGLYPSWVGGTLWRTENGGLSWIPTQGFSNSCTFGLCTNALSVYGCHLVQTYGSLTVNLYTGTLTSVTESGLYDEELLFAYGAASRWEILACKNVTANADGSFTLDTFIRGLRGTEWTTGLHVAGDYLVFLKDIDNAFISVLETQIGAVLTFRGVSNGRELGTEIDSTITYAAENLTPLSPVHVIAIEANNDITFYWSRRDRVNAGWNNYGDIPLSEATESYELDILNTAGTVVLRTLISAVESVLYTSAQQIIDFGVNVSNVDIALYQKSALIGRGHPFTGEILVANAVPIDGRYWRVYVTANNGATGLGNTTIVELKYYDMLGVVIDTFTNRVAATLADSEANTSNKDEFAFDLNTTNKWSCGSAAVPHWIRYDFTTNRAIGKIKMIGCIAGQSANAPKDFIVQAAYDAAGPWTDVRTITGQTAWAGAEEREFILQL